MSRYAQDTQVSSDRSRAEIEKTLTRYGAESFMYGWQGQQARLGFQMHGRRIQFALTMPDPVSLEFIRTPTGKDRSVAQAQASYEKAVRQRWRALALVIKAKLEAVESGISVFEEEFLAQIVLPNGGTVGQHMLPQIAHAYDTGTMPALLPGPS